MKIITHIEKIAIILDNTLLIHTLLLKEPLKQNTMNRYTIIELPESPDAFVFYSKKKISHPFFTKNQAYSTILKLLCETEMTTHEARDLALDVYKHPRLIFLIKEKLDDTLASTNHEHVAFILNFSRVIEILKTHTSFPNLFVFKNEFREQTGWIILKKPSITIDGQIYFYSLEYTYYFYSRESGVNLVLKLYNNRAIDLSSKEYLIDAIEKSSFPEVSKKTLN